MAKYVNINRQVCQHKSPSMFRYFAIYVDSPKIPFFALSFCLFLISLDTFFSLTETVDSFAKGILNQRTHVPVVVKHHDNSDDFDNSCTPKSCPLLSLLSSIMPTGWFWPFVSLLNFRKFYLVVNTQDVPRAMYLLPFAFPFSRLL